MDSKAKVQKGVVDDLAAVSEAVAQIDYYREKVETNLSLAEAALTNLRTAKERLSRVSARLRDLLEGQKHGRSPSQGPDRSPSVRRKLVASNLQRVSSVRSRKRRLESRKRVPRKQAIPEFFGGGATHPDDNNFYG